MLVTYSNGSEVIETVYTYEEWLKEYNRRETKRRIRQRTERLCYIKQCLLGLIMIIIGMITLFILKELAFALFALSFGIFLLLTKEKVMTF